MGSLEALYSLIDGFEIIGCILLDCHAGLGARAADHGFQRVNKTKKVRWTEDLAVQTAEEPRNGSVNIDIACSTGKAQ